MKLSAVISVPSTDITRIEAVAEDAENPTHLRRVRIMFGDFTLFMKTADVPQFCVALEAARLKALTQLSEAETASLLRSIETDS